MAIRFRFPAGPPRPAGYLSAASSWTLLLLFLVLSMPIPSRPSRAWAQPSDPTAVRPDPPATTEPRYPPTPLPKDEPDDDEDEADEAPAAPDVSPTAPPPGFALPARTQRPTRTPRATALPTATPLAAGGLRLSMSASPPVLRLRESATFSLDLVNQGDQTVDGLVIDIAAPDVLIAYDAQVRSGEISRAGGLISWHLPRFAPGERSSLRLSGQVARAGGERTGLCATVISSGAALEHCASFEVSSGPPAAATQAAPALLDPSDDADAETAPSGVEALRQAGRPGLLAGLSLLLAGAVLLGAWWTRAGRSAGRPAAARSAARERDGPGSEGREPSSMNDGAVLPESRVPPGTPASPSSSPVGRAPRRPRRGTTRQR